MTSVCHKMMPKKSEAIAKFDPVVNFSCDIYPMFSKYTAIFFFSKANVCISLKMTEGT